MLLLLCKDSSGLCNLRAAGEQIRVWLSPGTEAGPAGIIFGTHGARAGLCVASFIWGKINNKMTLEVEFFVFWLSLKR